MENNEKITFQRLTDKHDAAIARLVRENLKAHGLDIPGTAYFDEGLDHLSQFYNRPGRFYWVLLKGEEAIGGIGLAEFCGDCCELQKLYLADHAKGHGLGYEMIAAIEKTAKEMGYRQIYLETHTNLRAALHIYEKMGYREIDRPESVIHTTMNKFFLKTL